MMAAEYCAPITPIRPAGIFAVPRVYRRDFNLRGFRRPAQSSADTQPLPDHSSKSRWN